MTAFLGGFALAVSFMTLTYASIYGIAYWWVKR